VITWIRGGELVDPEKGSVDKVDVMIERGRISRILPNGTLKDPGTRVRVLDATGKLVIPGLVDMHVHLREPGEEYKETVESGTRAAVSGGFTAVACMPNTIPPNDCRSVTEFLVEQARKARLAKVYPVAAITMGRRGELLTEFGDLRTAGAVGVSDDGSPVVNSQVMRRALEYARHFSLTVISHCEDPTLSAGGVVHEGAVATRVGLPGISPASEEIMVCRDICLAKWTGCPVHIAHVSTAGSVEQIRRAKESGVPVTAETAPHYFTLDHGAVAAYDTCAKVNPPLRTPEDVASIRGGLRDGTIDAIATDHAPHSPLEKEVEFDKAASGMIGLETALPLTLVLVREGILSLPEAIRKLSLNPARILGVPGGRPAVDSEADLVILNPDREYVLTESDIVSRSKNTPFIGRQLKGRVELTMIGGRVVWQR
jgi:dihydroorotase